MVKPKLRFFVEKRACKGYAIGNPINNYNPMIFLVFWRIVVVCHFYV